MSPLGHRSSSLAGLLLAGAAVGGNWAGLSVPVSSPTTTLNFGAAANYAPNNNIAGTFQLNAMTFAATAASGQAVSGYPSDEGMGRLQQGSLEGSNVEIVQEMVDMITAMRAYEINSKAIKNSEEMLEIANNLVR